jgi:hypothetical protein
MPFPGRTVLRLAHLLKRADRSSFADSSASVAELERLTMISSSYARSWLLASDTYGRFDMSISVPDTNSDYERARKPKESSERGAAQVRR